MGRVLLENRQLAQFVKAAWSVQKWIRYERRNGEGRRGAQRRRRTIQGREKHPCDVKRDVALADDRHMLRL
jgi:hypothetical protein